MKFRSAADIKSRKKLNRIFLLFFLLLFVFLLTVFTINKINSYSTIFQEAEKTNQAYSRQPQIVIYTGPSIESKKIITIRHSTWFDVLGKEGEWTKVRLFNLYLGFVLTSHLCETWIKILKDERELHLIKGAKILKRFPIALGSNPGVDKIKIGDSATPLGRFYICERIRNPQKARYGARSLRISYPSIDDARRGLQSGIIDKKTYHDIFKAIQNGKMPSQKTRLGASIRIHGGGTGSDWTLGCIAMNNVDVIELFDLLPEGIVIVDIYQNNESYQRYNDENYINDLVVNALHQLKSKGCKYTNEATRYIPISYPMGDFNPSIGVCTDLIIRALRTINIDLQALVYEDFDQYPKRYPVIKKHNTHVDHRRVRNLKEFFEDNAYNLTTEPPATDPDSWMPGDIVIFDTGVSNGTPLDHIGIVSSSMVNGVYLVYNLWTIGYNIEEMELLNGDYPKIMGHYRLLHPYYYNSVP